MGGPLGMRGSGGPPQMREKKRKCPSWGYQMMRRMLNYLMSLRSSLRRRRRCEAAGKIRGPGRVLGEALVYCCWTESLLFLPVPVFRRRRCGATVPMFRRRRRGARTELEPDQALEASGI